MGRVTGSVWLQADSNNPPGTVTLTLQDLSSGQVQTKVVVPPPVADRFAISGYFTNTSTGVSLTVSWDSPTGIIYMDGMQIEKNDWATEYFTNTSTTDPLLRKVFAAPDRVLGAGRYQPGTTPVDQDIFILDPSLFPDERAARPFLLGRSYFSLKGGKINVDNVQPDLHLLYRAKRIPPKLAAGTDTVYIPDPWYWVLVRGANAFLQSAMYDIGANADSHEAQVIFDAIIDETMAMSEPIPNYTFLPNNYPRMMR